MFSRQRQERPIDLALPSHTRTIHTKNHRPSSSVEGLVDKYDGVEWESKDDVILDEPSLMDLPAENTRDDLRPPPETKPWEILSRVEHERVAL
jgi:hypothetical protein